MGKTADGKEEVKDTTDTLHLLQLVVDPKKVNDLNDILQTIDEYEGKVLATIDEELSTRFLMRNKNPLRMQRYIADVTHEMAKYTFQSLYAIDNLETRVSTLEKIINEITKKLNIDLPNVKTEIENLKTTINSPTISRASTWIQDMDKAFAKLDKNRKDVLRDSLV